MTLKSGAGHVHTKVLPLNSDTDQISHLVHWFSESVPQAAACLDVGSGDGDDTYTQRIKELCATLVGVDPDEHGGNNHLVDTWFQGTIEDYVAGPHELFDAIVCVYVVEHVGDPEQFLAALRKCLRPGGSCFIVTPNLWHYFGVAAKVTQKVGVQDRLLARIRRNQPTISHVDHFPVRYQMNSISAITRAAEATGFREAEFHMLDNPSVFKVYFPGRFGRIPELYSKAICRLNAAKFYGTIICRIA